jgi:Tfp pilus assembly protein PilV
MMIILNNKRVGKPSGPQAGLSLFETVIALAILLVVSVGIMSLGAVALTAFPLSVHAVTL